MVKNVCYYQFYSCRNCGYHEEIFGSGIEAFSKQRNIPIIAKIPLVGEIRAASDAGTPIAADVTSESGLVFASLAGLFR